MTVPGAGQPACAARAEYRARAVFFDERAQAAPITQENRSSVPKDNILKAIGG